MTGNDTSILTGLYALFYRKADEEKAEYYDKLLKLPNNISAVEVAKIERHILILDKFQSELFYKERDEKIPYRHSRAYDEEIAKYDKIINGGMT